MNIKDNPIGILLMAHGGGILSDIPGYLANIRNGRTTSKRIVNELLTQYEEIGGYSPLLKHSRAQLEALQKRLNPEKFRIYLGMRYWSPYIEETIEAMQREGIQKAVALVLAPQYSKVSVAKYHEQIHNGLDLYRAKIDFHFVNEFYQEPLFTQAMCERLNQGFSMWRLLSESNFRLIYGAQYSREI